jgi:glycine/D-amino acid oxidase-like deaminating enzyme
LAPAPLDLRCGRRRKDRSDGRPRVPDSSLEALAERWAGLIDVTPDAVPVISAVPAIPGFFIASGFSAHGFGIGPGAGHLMADLLTGARSIVDPAPYDFRRAA